MSKPEEAKITIYLGKDSTKIEVNDGAVALPAMRVERALREVHKTIQRAKIKKVQVTRGITAAKDAKQAISQLTK